jgi:hypothetical protein
MPSRPSAAVAASPPAMPDVRAFREGRRAVPLAEYEALLSTDRWAPRRVREADLVLSEGWKRGTLPRVPLEPPVAWETVCASNRSWQYHLMAWEAMSLVLSAHQHLGDKRYVDYCLGLALDWIGCFPSPEVDRAFAWYDMAIGLRAYRLGYLLDVVARDPEYGDEAVERLMAAAETHAQTLLDEARFVSHTNHGLYQAAGQLALARRFPELPSMEATRRSGAERLAAMTRSQFAGDGIHREHSPGYHYLLLDTLERLLHCGLIEDPEVAEIARRAEEALAWLVMPDRRIAQIGDSSDRTVRDEPFNLTENRALRFVVSAGTEGRPPEHRLQAYPESGWIVMRSGWAGGERFGEASYLAQIAAFHSRAHKHADDFSFVWFDRGRELLVDSGRYGYLGRLDAGSELGRQGFMYADPNRVYVESTRAHNTVEIDGLSHPRRVPPYGSGLVAWGERDGVMHSECFATFHETVGHRRILVFRPGSWLVVIDALADRRGRRRSFSQRFHFAPELAPAGDGEGVRAPLSGRDESLWMVPLLAGVALDPVVRGREEPDMLGFVSREPFEMIPAATAAFQVDGRPAHVFATLLALGPEAPEPDAAACRLDADGRRGVLSWRQGGAADSLALDDGRPQGTG